MTDELIAAFETQLRTLAQQIVDERDALSQLEDREAAAIQKEKIAGLEKLAAAIYTSRSAILGLEREQEQAAVNYVRWRELVAACREAQAQIADVEQRWRPLEDSASVALGPVERTERELDLHNLGKLKPSDLPLEAELLAEAKRGEKLKAAYAEAVAARGKLLAKRDALRVEWLRLRAKVSDLSWREERLRPKSLKPMPNGDMSQVTVRV